MSYDRDGDIYDFYMSGTNENDIAAKYMLSVQRIREIIFKQKQLHKSDVYNPDIYQIDAMCRILGWRECDRAKLQLALHQNGYTSYDNKWKKLTPDDILALPSLGHSAMCVIWLAQNMAGYDVEDWKN